MKEKGKGAEEEEITAIILFCKCIFSRKHIKSGNMQLFKYIIM